MCKSTTLVLCSILIANTYKCISGQLEQLAGVVKLEFIHRSVIYIYIYIYRWRGFKNV